eukprot:3940881-Prymnesium_polylepis.1
MIRWPLGMMDRAAPGATAVSPRILDALIRQQLLSMNSQCITIRLHVDMPCEAASTAPPRITCRSQLSTRTLPVASTQHLAAPFVKEPLTMTL